MQNIIQQIVYSHLPAAKKSTSGGWMSFNAVCCQHRGESRDKKRRGGVIFGGDGGITYHCFNCQFKTSWRPGRGISIRFRKWLSWINMPQNEIDNLRLQVLRFADERWIKTQTVTEIKFETKQLPEGSSTFAELATWFSLLQNSDAIQDDQRKELEELADVVNYADARLLLRQDNEHLAWTPQKISHLNQRLIIPFRYQKQIVGYTARAIDDKVNPRYLTVADAGYVFNMDAQTRQRQFVIVCEGPIDAITLDGVAVLGSSINATQAKLINSLQRQVIVVPDFDQHLNKHNRSIWPGHNLVKQAVDLGWSVSFPNWREQCKDINSAAQRYGKLFTLKNILDNALSNNLKIALMTKKVLADAK